jgi:hypothetical protein
MRAYDGKRLCQEAEVYYYDLLCQDEAAVPASIRDHVETCPVCQEQIHCLRDTLLEAETNPSHVGSSDDATIEALPRQFQLLDEDVTCTRIRPFLPELLIASPQIRVATPVTVHIDHCPQCAEDLAALGKLDLTTDQLKRLGRLFQDHVNAHPQGQPEVYQGRECRWGAVHEDEMSRKAIGCDSVSTADIFDYVVPYGPAPAEEGPRTIASHIRACPVCMGKVQRLHRTLYRILERADSGTTTAYHADLSVSSTVQATRTRGLGRSTRSLARVAVTAVAGVALVMLLWTNAPTASGRNVGNLLKAFAQAENVYVAETVSDDARPFEERWIARRWGKLVMRNNDECVLYDLNHRCKRIIDPQTGISAPIQLRAVECNGVRRIMASCLGDVLAQVSPDTKLDPIQRNAPDGATTDLDVYEVPLPPRPHGDSPGRAWWRAFVDPKTGLPQKTELHQEGPPESRITTVFTYLTERQMDNSIRAMFPAK